jgi:CelD/BcsL family acetyltransferase involved in cellulose biosynthesis
MELAWRMSALGQFALYVLKLDGKVLAFKYCVRGGGRLDSLKTGFDPTWRRFSPGVVTQFLVARSEVEEAEIHAIHLGHPEPHKLRWATGVAPLAMLDVYSRTPRGRIAYARPGLLGKMPAPALATSRRVVSSAREAAHRLRIEIGKRLSR